MEANKIAKQMIGFQKEMFNNSYTSMVIVQDQTENMMNGFFNQIPWISEENKKPMREVSEFVKKSREDFKKTIDDSYIKLEKMVDQ